MLQFFSLTDLENCSIKSESLSTILLRHGREKKNNSAQSAVLMNASVHLSDKPAQYPSKI
jgi:hypothetical protein